MPTYVQMALRATIAYFILLSLTRLMGKREISQMTFFDYTVGITIGTLTGSMITDVDISWYEVLPALLIFVMLQIISAFLSMKSINFRRLVDGSSTVLIKEGKILEDNMRKVRFNSSELLSKLHEKNVFKFADVETAILENDGKLSVQKKSNKQPVTSSDMNINVQPSGLPMVMIEDGAILGENLKKFGITRVWLISKLADQGVYDIKSVMMAQVDTSGNMYVDLYDDFSKTN